MSIEELYVKISADINGLKQSVSEAKKALGETSSEADSNSSKISKSFDSAGKAAKKAMQSIGKAATAPMRLLGKTVGSALNKVKGMFEQAFTFGVLSKVIAQFGDKIKNVLAQNESFKASVASLKGSINTAMQPLIELAIPILQKAIGYATQLADAFARVAATLSGKTVASLAEAAKANDKLAKSGNTASFDQLNKLSNGGTQADYTQVVAEAKSSKSLLDTIKQTLAGLFDAIDKGMSKVAGLLPTMLSAAGDLGADLVNKVTGSIDKIANYDWSGIGKSLGTALSDMFTKID